MNRMNRKARAMMKKAEAKRSEAREYTRRTCSYDAKYLRLHGEATALETRAYRAMGVV